MSEFDSVADYRAARERRERELPEGTVMFQARRGGRVLTRYWNRHLEKPVGIRATQLDVLAVVKISPNSKIAALADRLGLAHCTLSRSLKRLEMNGLVTSVIGRHDRRQRWPKLTELGERALDAGRQIVEETPQLRMRTRLGVETCKRVRADSEAIARGTHAQTREESFVDAGLPLWNRDDYEKRWAGWTEEDIHRDRVERARRRNTERRENDASAKPPPKKPDGDGAKD